MRLAYGHATRCDLGAAKSDWPLATLRDRIKLDKTSSSFPSASVVNYGFSLLTIKDMSLQSNAKVAIIRTERGLTISGTRITLYDVMDYLTAQYPPKFIRGLFNLTEEQINAALAYIKANAAEVEAEYQIVVKEAEELRQYYEQRNRDLIARLAKKPPLPGREAAWEKLQAQKAKHQAQFESQP